MSTWVRIRDTTTGHQWDVDLQTLPAWLTNDAIEEVAHAGRVDGDGAHPRPPQHFTGLDGKPRTKPPARKPADDSREQT